LREVVSAEAVRRGIERKPDFQQQLNDAKQRLLADTLLNELATQNPVSEKELLSEYERQKTSLGGDAAVQYKLSQIVVASEQEGRDVVARLRKGEGFDKLAAAVSTDADSKAKAGDMGWFLPLELAPVFGNVVVNLPKGGFTAAPIGFNNQWFVIKVDDTRPFKVPSLQESRARLQAALQQQKRQKLIDDLLKKASVQIGNL
jgi:peptidyl-prolyl cis-trans isomerase C